MRQLLAKPQRQRKTLIAGVAAFATMALLSACATPGSQQPGPTQAVITKPSGTPSEFIEQELPASEFSSEFSRAEQALFNYDWQTASVIMDTIPADRSSITDGQYLTYLQARIDYIRGDQRRAQKSLIELDKTTQVVALHTKIALFRCYMSRLSGHYLTSAQLADQLLRQASPGAKSDTLRRSIWQDLQRLQSPQIQAAMNEAPDWQWRGWLELALAARALPQNTQMLQQWRISHDLHPAATVLPGGLGHLFEATTKPEKVAILLPLSGRLAPAGQAVRDGYLASYYAARTAGTASFELSILDVLSFPSVTEAYRTALAEGANFIVGPLSKQAVAELGELPNRQVPILALNRLDKTLPAGDTALVQLALAPEDEARQIADLAYGRGTRKALVIHPAGAWGNKMNEALKTQWKKLGGIVSTTATYSSREDYSTSMSAALQLPGSEQRAREVRKLLATGVEFTARRRQDIDVVFLLSRSGVEARSLKPLLAYHYAADLPVFATSSVYQGTPDSRDQDLNGINLIETPWLLGTSPDNRAVLAVGNPGSNNYTRLNALGADAYLLQSNFARLQAGEELLIRGNTGLLSLNPQLHIQRELQTATFDGGVLTAQ